MIAQQFKSGAFVRSFFGDFQKSVGKHTILNTAYFVGLCFYYFSVVIVFADYKNFVSFCVFVIKQGQKIALVGASGSGKSTIAKLLLKYYEPEAGKIVNLFS